MPLLYHQTDTLLPDLCENICAHREQRPIYFRADKQLLHSREVAVVDRFVISHEQKRLSTDCKSPVSPVFHIWSAAGFSLSTYTVVLPCGIKFSHAILFISVNPAGLVDTAAALCIPRVPPKEYVDPCSCRCRVP